MVRLNFYRLAVRLLFLYVFSLLSEYDSKIVPCRSMVRVNPYCLAERLLCLRIFSLVLRSTPRLNQRSALLDRILVTDEKFSYEPDKLD